VAPPAARAPADEEQEILPNPPKRYPLAVLGVAAGCYLMAGILGGVALDRANEQEGNVKSPPVYTPTLRDHATEGKNLATAAYVFLGVGAAVTIADAVLWVEALRKPRTWRRKVATVLSPEGIRF
jgi:hypothetical protein